VVASLTLSPLSCRSIPFFVSTRRCQSPPPALPYTTLFRSCPAAGSCRTLRPRIHRPAEGFHAVVPFVRAGRGPAVRSRHDDGCRSEEHTSELQSREKLVCRLRLGKK